MNSTICYQAIQTSENIKILASIDEHGLRPLSQISPDILTNPVLQTQDLDGNICVNYLNMEKASPQERIEAIQVAIFEEYCGVYGICLERQWPFQRFTSQPLLHQEMSERLNHSIVFMLRPPGLYKGVYSSLSSYSVASYTSDHDRPADGVTQNRGRNLLDCSKDSCGRISEIKTTHHFSKADIFAAFVPEPLCEIAREVLKDIQIVPVTSCTKTFKAIPEILAIFHDHVLDKEVSLSIPDYFSSISSYINEKRITECSLHAVRMHTQFDFITRRIESVDLSADLLKEISAKVHHVDPDQSAWITVHKNYGLSKEKLINKLRKNFAENNFENYFHKIIEANRSSMALIEKLIKAKGKDCLTYLYQSLTPYQIRSLENIRVKVIQQSFCYVLSFKKTVQKRVEEILDSHRQPAIYLQALFRGFFVRKVINQYKQKREQLAIAQLEYRQAERAFNQLNGK